MNKILSLISFLIIFTVGYAQIDSLRPFNSEWPETYIETSLSGEMLKEVSREFSVDKVVAEGYDCYKVRLCIGRDDYAHFLSQGIPFTIVTGSKVNVRMAHSYEQLTDSWNRYPTWGAYVATMDTFQSQFPNICKIEPILNHTTANHKILAAHISNNLQERGNKPAFFYTSTMHGDEPVGYYLLLRLIEYLLNNYDSDPQVQNIINNVDLWICPIENPDGTYRNHNDSLGQSPYSTRSNYSRIDLNRSYPIVYVPFNGNGDYPSEVQAMLDFGMAHNFTMSANFHGGAEVYNYPWDTWESSNKIHADDLWWQYVGHNFANTCHAQNDNYMQDLDDGVVRGSDWYTTVGSRQDCYNYFLGCREVTIEVSADKVVSSNQLYKYWNYTRQALLDYIEESLNGIRGIVTDSVTGLPIEAEVYVENHDKDHSQVYSMLPEGNYHRPIKGGTYSVTYTAEDYYPKTITVSVADGQSVVQNVQLVSKFSGVDDQNLPAFVIYPNPTHGYLYVTSMVDPPKQFEFLMFDDQGRLIYQTIVEAGTSTLNITSLPAGAYVIHILDKGRSFYQTRIIKG